MKEDILTILKFLAVFAIAFIVSALLDIPFVANHWSRQAIVILLMMLILVLGNWTVIETIRNNKSKKEN